MTKIFDFTYLKKQLLQHKSTLVKAHIVAVFAAITVVLQPLFIPLLIDDLLLEGNGRLTSKLDYILPAGWSEPMHYIGITLAITLFLRFSGFALNILQTKVFTGISQEICYNIRLRVLGRLQNIAVKYFEQNGTGKTASLFTTDIDTVESFISKSISKLILSVLQLIATAAILLWINVKIGLFILLLYPAVIFLTVKLGKSVKKLKGSENKAIAGFQEKITDFLEAVHELRVSRRDKHFLTHIKSSAGTMRDAIISSQWKTDAASRGSFVLFLAGFDLFRVAAVYVALTSPDLSVGEMIAIFSYLWVLMGPVQELIGIQYSWFGASAAMDRVNTFINQDEEMKGNLSGEFSVGEKTGVEIAFDKVSFSYTEGVSVLDEVSLKIPAGQHVAIVGATGGGKSTLVQVLTGLYKPLNGTVSLNNQDIYAIGLDTVREMTGVVLQAPGLFQSTVRENILMGEHADDEEVWRSLQVACLDEFIREQADGLDTQVGSRGLKLSGGQRQRLAIARMVLRKPQIVILDEATSALDPQTENEVHKRLKAFLENRTTITVAHRLSAVKQAEKIYVFENGKIIQDGSHDDLVSQDGLYSKLYNDKEKTHERSEIHA
ncbi:MAG: ABC transporter ATP-binding protein/permease [Lentisphaerales bacterium]|nr:ABC transporter ATP-binding protein/permease [Lentisphaerales bacterium]